jgi:hypothetical protein
MALKPSRLRVGRCRAIDRVAVLLLGAVVFAGAIAEGAAKDWAAIHARRVLELDPGMAPLAFTVFSTAMTVISFLGDRIRGRLGATRTFRLAGSLVAAGYALVLWSSELATQPSICASTRNHVDASFMHAGRRACWCVPPLHVACHLRTLAPRAACVRG